MSSIEEYMINQIEENLNWLVKNTDVSWEVELDHESRWGISFRRDGKSVAFIAEGEM